MPDPDKVIATIGRAVTLLRSTAGRTGGVITLDPAEAEEVMIVGDIHGGLATFRKVLEIADLPRHPRRHLVLQELIHGKSSYPGDGGDRSHQLVDLFAALKCQHPEQVHQIIGNHELSELTGRIIGKDGEALNIKFRRGIETAYGARYMDVFQAYLKLFAALPVAVRSPNRVFLCHTLPDARYLDSLDMSVLHADDWPRESTERGGTIYALTWGRDTSPETADRFAEMVDAEWFITGHQPCQEGVRLANHRVVILDGTPPNPGYCIFPTTEPVTIDSLLGRARIIDLLS
jgi:hypothetical protein